MSKLDLNLACRILFTDAWAFSVLAGSTIKTWAELEDPKMRLLV